jgi:hypothetical protein
MRCKKCNGIGRVYNPDYPARAWRIDREFDSSEIDYPEYEHKLGCIFGRGSVPEESIPCPKCKPGRVPAIGGRV